jgi:hypothetical protein
MVTGLLANSLAEVTPVYVGTDPWGDGPHHNYRNRPDRHRSPWTTADEAELLVLGVVFPAEPAEGDEPPNIGRPH